MTQAGILLMNVWETRDICCAFLHFKEDLL
jgi:hypothetical protein